MGRYLLQTYGNSDLSFDVTNDNYEQVYQRIQSEQRIIELIPSDPNLQDPGHHPHGWGAAGHIDIFGEVIEI